MSAKALARPLPNSYWVLPGELLAGEHPARQAATVADVRGRLRELMDAGIDSFVDLTMPDEFDTYQDALPPDVNYARRPIRDHGIPSRPEQMAEIVAHIERELQQRRRVYVHCHAGIGRTGMVAGCLLIARGAVGDTALEQLNRLWRTCDRSRTWPYVPETDAQIAFVRAWKPVADPAAELTTLPNGVARKGRSPSAVADRGVQDRFRGALLGLAVGDALGVATQGLKPGSFTPIAGFSGSSTLNLPPGAWSDDTAIALCVAEGLIQCGRFEPRDQVERCENWQQNGYLTATGQCVGITDNTAQALAAARWRRQVFPGSHDPKHLDPEALTRVAPTVLFSFGSLEEAIHLACEASRITCQAPGALDACRLFAASLHGALAAESKERILDPPFELPDTTGVRPKVEAIRRKASMKSPRAGQTITETLAAALWAFETTSTFHEGALRAANLGGRSDAVSAAYGQLAGAAYGAEAIPEEWRAAVISRDLIEAFADALLAHSQRRAGPRIG